MWKIPLFKIYWDEDDVRLVNEAIRSGMNWAIGPNVARFEQMLAEYIGSKYCVTFNSGTSALHAVLLAHGIGKDDEVIVPSFTFIATANAPQFVGARAVFSDIEDQTFGLDPTDVQEKITKKTKAILPIHYGGLPCKIREMKEIAEDRGLILIEDAAEAFGAKIGNRKVGTFGDSAMLSFCQNKIITTGEGGAIVTDSREVYEKMKLIASHGRPDTCNYFTTTTAMEYVTLGYNFRISNITAALGIAQLRKVDVIIEKRREIAEYYTRRLQKEVPECRRPHPPLDHFNVYQLYSILAEQRNSLISYLENQSIMTKIYFSPVHRTYFYKEILKYDCELPVTDRISQSIISLPFHPDLSKKEVDIIVGSINEFYKVK